MKIKIILSAAICIVALLLIMTIFSNATGESPVNLSFKTAFLNSLWNFLKMFW